MFIEKPGKLFPGIFKSIINSYVSYNYFSQIILGITAEMYRLFSVKSNGIVGADRYVFNLFACLCVIKENLYDVDVNKLSEVEPTAVMFKGKIVSGEF